MKNPRREDFYETSDHEGKIEILETSSIWKHFNFEYSNNSAFGQDDYAVVTVHSYSGFFCLLLSPQTLLTTESHLVRSVPFFASIYI